MSPVTCNNTGYFTQSHKRVGREQVASTTPFIQNTERINYAELHNFTPTNVCKSLSKIWGHLFFLPVLPLNSVFFCLFFCVLSHTHQKKKKKRGKKYMLTLIHGQGTNEIGWRGAREQQQKHMEEGKEKSIRQGG